MRLLSTVLLVLLAPALSFSQVERSSDLYTIMKAKDSLLFEIGFNHLDTAVFQDLLDENFEFYHDEAGMATSKEAFIQSVKALGALNYKPLRQLTDASLQVFPLLKNGVLYGAIQSGEHQFYSNVISKPDHLTSTARFTEVWLLQNHQWKLHRVLSYDHQLPSKTIDDDSLLFIDKPRTEQWLTKHRIPALAIGYIREGSVENISLYGSKDGKPRPANTIFDVASLTKPITTLVTLQLVSKGDWKLDEPVFHYWTDPDVAADPRSKLLTTRHILSHQSGFPNWRDGHLAFEFSPGSQYQYSGEGFEYLRKAIEHKFNKTLDQLANEIIFKPLGMHDTRFFPDSTFSESQFAGQYSGTGVLYQTHFNTSANAANHLLTTIEDYTKFIAYVMAGGGLRDSIFQQMISQQVRIKPRKYWGLGWWVDERVNSSEHALLHGGDDKGVHTIAILLPRSKQGLVIFTNCDNGTDVYIPILQHFLPQTIAEEIITVETK